MTALEIVLFLAIAIVSFFAGYQTGRIRALTAARGSVPDVGRGPVPSHDVMGEPRTSSHEPPSSSSARRGSAPPPASAGGGQGAGGGSSNWKTNRPRRSSKPPPAAAGLMGSGDTSSS